MISGNSVYCPQTNQLVNIRSRGRLYYALLGNFRVVSESGYIRGIGTRGPGLTPGI